MGNLVSWFQNKFSRKNANLLILGLDAAGKTSILSKLKLGDIIESVPTIGFNIETVKFHNITFKMWDIGGQERLRSLWKHYYSNADAIIFVFDSNDKERFDVAKNELKVVLSSPSLAEASLLILCNKQDLPYCLRPNEIAQKLLSDSTLLSYLNNRSSYFQGCSTYNGNGLYEGLDWLCSHLPDS